MSRVLLVGAGPLPSPRTTQTSFAQLRTRHFLGAMTRAGHEVGLACIQPAGEPDAADPERSTARVWSLEDDARLVARLGEIAAEWRPDVWVSAGPYAPLRTAAALGDRPYWADIPGDPFAEAQARATRLAAEPGQEPLPDGPQRAHALAAMGALERADAFSVCSGPQRLALLGQLGVLGRLGISRPARRWAWAVPPAWDFGLPLGTPRARAPGQPLVVALAGSFNTWLAEDALVRGLIEAMEGGIVERVLVVGGSVPGHSERGMASFADRASTSRHSSRFELLGWIPHGDLPRILAPAHLLLSADLPGAEPVLGSRTRLLFGLHQGLQVVSTTACELARDLAARGFLAPLPEATPAAVAATLEELAVGGCDGSTVARAQAELARVYDPDALVQPLLRWLEAPDRAPAGSALAGSAARELARVQAELAGVYATPTWRLLSWLHGALGRWTGGS